MDTLGSRGLVSTPTQLYVLGMYPRIPFFQDVRYQHPFTWRGVYCPPGGTLPFTALYSEPLTPTFLGLGVELNRLSGAQLYA